MEAKAKTACRGCDKLFSKPTVDWLAPTKLLDLVYRCMRIRQERMSGFPRTKDQLRTVEFEVLLIVDAMFESAQRHAQSEISEILLAVFGGKN